MNKETRVTMVDMDSSCLQKSLLPTDTSTLILIQQPPKSDPNSKQSFFVVSLLVWPQLKFGWWIRHGSDWVRKGRYFEGKTQCQFNCLISCLWTNLFRVLVSLSFLSRICCLRISFNYMVTSHNTLRKYLLSVSHEYFNMLWFTFDLHESNFNNDLKLHVAQ